MRDNSSENDPKTIWQNQPTEPSTMTLVLIRQKVRALHAKTRRELARNVIVPLIMIAFTAMVSLTQAYNSVQIIVFALAFVWALAGQYFLNRGMWSARLPGDAALNTSIEFYRHEVQRRRSLFGRVMPWSFGPILLAIGAYILPILRMGFANHRLFANMIPFLVLLLCWIISVFVLRMRQQRELQREIDGLDEIEREQKTM